MSIVWFCIHIYIYQCHGISLCNEVIPVSGFLTHHVKELRCNIWQEATVILLCNAHSSQRKFLPQLTLVNAWSSKKHCLANSLYAVVSGFLKRAGRDGAGKERLNAKFLYLTQISTPLSNNLTFLSKDTLDFWNIYHSFIFYNLKKIWKECELFWFLSSYDGRDLFIAGNCRTVLTWLLKIKTACRVLFCFTFMPLLLQSLPAFPKPLLL